MKHLDALKQIIEDEKDRDFRNSLYNKMYWAVSNKSLSNNFVDEFRSTARLLLSKEISIEEANEILAWVETL
jgi:hypothetical protein